MRVGMLPLGGAALLAACGGGAAIGGGDLVMMYAVPVGNPLAYERTDSLEVSLQAPGTGSFTLRFDQAMTLGVGFEPTDSGVRVTATVRRLSASMTNPLGPPATLSEGDVEGDLIFAVDGRGDARLIDLPEVSGAGGPLFNATSLAYDLLPKLSPNGVVPGGSWVDTTTYGGEDATGAVDVTWVGTSTLIGDTIADGRLLTLVRTEADVTIELVAVVSGMAVTQSMSGPETGFYLWDSRRRAMVQQGIERDLTGTVKVAVLPTPMNLTAKQTKTMKLIGG